MLPLEHWWRAGELLACACLQALFVCVVQSPGHEEVQTKAERGPLMAPFKARVKANKRRFKVGLCIGAFVGVFWAARRISGGVASVFSSLSLASLALEVRRGAAVYLRVSGGCVVYLVGWQVSSKWVLVFRGRQATRA